MKIRVPIFGVSSIDENEVTSGDIWKMFFTSKQFAIISPNKRLRLVKDYENLRRLLEERMSKNEVTKVKVIDLKAEAFTLYED